MARRLEVLLGLALTAASLPAAGEPARDSSPESGPLASEFGKRKEPITVSSDALEYDYKTNVVVYRGDVQAAQGPVKLRSDILTVTFESTDAKSGGTDKAADKSSEGGPVAKTADKAPAEKTPPFEPMEGSKRLRQIVATGSVRIDHGTRWATGGRAVFDQGTRTIVLSESPVLHDGNNEVVGDRVIVYLDEDRSVVEGGRKRVKALLYPNKGDGLAPRDGAADPQTSATAGARR